MQFGVILESFTDSRDEFMFCLADIQCREVDPALGLGDLGLYSLSNGYSPFM